MSLSAPVTVQVREYIDPTIGVDTLEATLTVMVGSGDEKVMIGTSIELPLTLHSDGHGC